MGVVAALLDSRAANATLRRSLAAREHTILGCRQPKQLTRQIEGNLLDAIVLGAKAARSCGLEALRSRYPSIPLLIFGAFRQDETDQLLGLADRAGVDAILVEGLDDPMLGDAIGRHSLTSRRLDGLRNGPQMLRLTEKLQIDTWEILVRCAGRPPTTGVLAKRLDVSREYLSRQFAAGGAPNLKRVIDLLRVIAGRDLFANPGYSRESVARLLGYSTASYLDVVVRRVARLTAEDLRRTSVHEVLRRFVSGGMRSRA